MKYFILMVLVIQCALGVPDAEWQAYKKQFKKNFASKAEEEEARGRHDIADKIIKENNDKHDKGESDFRMAHNKFTCMSEEEKSAYRNLKQRPAALSVRAPSITAHPAMPTTYTTTGKNIDRRTSKVPVRDQGACGACWAFAAVGILEYLYASKNITVDLSEQQVIDCAHYSAGCNGGLVSDGIDEFLKKGIDYESVYKYTSGTSGVQGSCKYINILTTATAGIHPDVGTFKPTACYESFPNSELKMAYYTEKFGWTAIGVDATDPFMYYSSGILSATSCAGTTVDHAVIAVGFGTEASTGKKYWLVRNSWGSGWGDAGHIKLQRDANACALKNYWVNNCI